MKKILTTAFICLTTVFVYTNAPSQLPPTNISIHQIIKKSLIQQTQLNPESLTELEKNILDGIESCAKENQEDAVKNGLHLYTSTLILQNPSNSSESERVQLFKQMLEKKYDLSLSTSKHFSEKNLQRQDFAYFAYVINLLGTLRIDSIIEKSEPQLALFGFNSNIDKRLMRLAICMIPQIGFSGMEKYIQDHTGIEDSKNLLESLNLISLDLAENTINPVEAASRANAIMETL